MKNLFDAVNAARRVLEPVGAVIERTRRYRHRYTIRTSQPAVLPSGVAVTEITVCAGGVRRTVHTACVNDCVVYWRGHEQ